MAFNLQNMFKQAGGPVSINSTLIPMDQLKSETIDAIRNATILAAVNKAYELWGPGQVQTIRDLNGTDMGYPTNNFTQLAAAAANAWNGMVIGAFTVPTATVIAIYGITLGWAPAAATQLCPITGIRIDVGGSRHVQWNVQSLDQHFAAAPAVDFGMVPRVGITRSPVVAAEDMTVTLFEYTRTVGVAYFPVWLGVAVEKEGVTLKP